ncbi:MULTISPECIES: hypothetical protein [Sphingobium]|uniref:hypothetical protein n=1 Tax=Sphingobium TaxID=165695 RepID=UPI002432E52D|nr:MULTISPECIES: hypothetical protein [Sphingobium]MBR2267123.1 hypothetical protein [Sphingobium sp.]
MAAGSGQITVLADRGHCNCEQVLEHDGAGILLCLPMVDTSDRAQRGLFTRPDFIYTMLMDNFPHQTAEKRQDEMILDVPAYNMKRMIQIYGFQSCIQAIRARSVKSAPLPACPDAALFTQCQDGCCEEDAYRK